MSILINLISQNINNKSECIDLIYNELNTKQKNISRKELCSKISERERLGQIYVGNNTIMPHLETNIFNNSKLIFIFTKTSFQWNEHMINKVLFFLIGRKGKENVKEILSWYFDKLINNFEIINNPNIFYYELKKEFFHVQKNIYIKTNY